MSKRPNVRTAAATASRTSGSFVTLPGSAKTCPPFRSMSLTTRSNSFTQGPASFPSILKVITPASNLMLIFNIGYLRNLLTFLETPPRPQAAIPQDEWIHELAALHAALSQEIEVAAVTEKIEALFGHHETPAAPAPLRADEFLPLGNIIFFNISFF